MTFEGRISRNVRWTTLLAGMFFMPLVAAAQTVETIIPTGGSWRYLDDGSDLGTAWASPGFDDTTWATGPAELGYGDGDEDTLVGYGPDPAAKFITTYFRHAFNIGDPAAYAALHLGVLRDDGAVVYVNGVEVFRTNMLAGSVDYATLAALAISGAEETTFFATEISPDLLVAGTNVVAVEVHQSAPSSSDLSFDLVLDGTLGNRITRGPYLQRATPDSLVVRWRTSIASDSRVSFGDAPGNLTGFADEPGATTEHEVEVGGLTPDTTYSYAVGSTSEVLAGDDPATFFVTPPIPGTAKPTRIWVIGDSGTADANARAVRDAYVSFAGSRMTDLWLMLGDNAYPGGTDAEYEAAVFDTYPSLLRQTVLWPTVGNHDGASQSANESGPYYDAFTLPRDGAAGGVASGTEAYYSFDYGNIHFVVLNSHDVDRTPTSPMWTWLELDLADTALDWIVAFWHHPPYSKGSHDSDDPSGAEFQLVQMREQALPILEDLGVDLVLTGHSHSYERSFLLDGHYGHSSTLGPAMILDGGDGSLFGAGAYRKESTGPAPHEGAVYVVAGNAGQTEGGPLDHPAMFAAFDRLGSLVLDVDGNVLDGFFLDVDGSIADQFRIVHGDGPMCTPGTLVTTGSIWRYLDDGSDQGTAWAAAGFDDSTWAAGPAELGYGDGDEATVVGSGSLTTYFRHTFQIAEASSVSGLDLRLLRDDGAVVYLNGVEILRSNMPGGTVDFGTLAAGPVTGLAETTFANAVVDASALVDGANVLAVEIHQVNGFSSDISFDLELVGAVCLPPAASVTGLAWNDADADGIREPGETAQEAVAVDLVDDSGAVLTSTTTVADGTYAFTDLAPGAYRVRFTAPADHAISPADQGGDDSLDSDADPATGLTALLALGAGETRGAVDVGLGPVSTLIFADNFESGNLSAWSSVRTDGSDLSVTAAAALEGQAGLAARINDRNLLWVQDDSPAAERSYRMRFALDVNGLTIPNNKPFMLFQGATSLPFLDLLHLELRFRAGAYQIQAETRRSGNGWATTPWVTIGNQPTVIEIDWKAASVVGTNDGSLTLSVDGTGVSSLTGIDNPAAIIDLIRLGAVKGIAQGTNGTFYLDAFESWR